MNQNCKTMKNPVNKGNHERATLIVVVLTLVTMVLEISAGFISGSMALLSDGVHMGTHAVALLITLVAYIITRRNRNNPLFCFGTGKVGILGGYTNAILLIIAGLAMAYESVERIINPITIHFNEAIVVAVIGLIVNIVSAVVLGRGSSDHGHSHSHSHHSNAGEKHQDHNMKAAYLHVITDALTSVLAIFALIMGKYLGLIWADAVIGILGSVVIIKWALGLIKDTGFMLLDMGDFAEEIQTIKKQIEMDGSVIEDIHIWQISENEKSLIISLVDSAGKTPEMIHQMIKKIAKFSHVTVEIRKNSLATVV